MIIDVPPGTPIVDHQNGIVEATDDIILGDSAGSPGTFRIAQGPVNLKMNNHRMIFDPWYGDFEIDETVIIEDLGTAQDTGDTYGFYMQSGGNAFLKLNAVLRTSSTVKAWAGQNASVNIDNITVEANSLVPAPNDVTQARLAIFIEGNSPEPKSCAGARVFKSGVWLNGLNWSIYDFIAVGLRANLIVGGSQLSEGEGSTYRDCYIHRLSPAVNPNWSQVSALSSGPGTLGERVVVRNGQWTGRGIAGDLNNFMVFGTNGHAHIENAPGNLRYGIVTHRGEETAVEGQPINDPTGQACVIITENEEAGVFEFITFDGMDGLSAVGGMALWPNSMLNKLKHCLFVRFNTGARAVIDGKFDEAPLIGAVRAEYMDYNAFHGSFAARYGIQGQPGYGSHDLTLQDTGLAGPLPTPLGFLYDYNNIISGALSVQGLLDIYRAAYAPYDGSPLIGAGDLVDGSPTIGCVQSQSQPGGRAMRMYMYGHA